MPSIQSFNLALRELLSECFEEVLGHTLPEDRLDQSMELPKNESFGELATHLCLPLAKEQKIPPRSLAQKVAELFLKKLPMNPLRADLETVTVEGPGYINFRLSLKALTDVLVEIHQKKDDFGMDNLLQKKILLEFVSANPTGPLTAAHGRQAALGDSLARLLKHAGARVETEYYNNDEGVQIEALGRSLFARISEKKGTPMPIPENGYHGMYLVDTAGRLIREKHPVLSLSEEQAVPQLMHYAKNERLEVIMKDLEDFGVNFDRIFSQEALSQSGDVEKTLERLKQKKVIYQKEGALWFRSTDFGDDKDRVLIKSDKSYTYLTPDIAYHDDKFRRGYDELINIWGPDHHGYIARIKASQAALGHDSARIRILIAQLVTLYEGKKQVRMSKRSGEFVTLRDILQEVGRDAARFFFCMRRFESHLDFDLELAKKNTQDNPVFYIQYAHARISSLCKHQAADGPLGDPAKADFNLLKTNEEVRVLRLVRQFPHRVYTAALQAEPCMMIEYLTTLAASFHQFYANCRVVSEDRALTAARLSLALGLQSVLRTGLSLLGVSAPDTM